MALGTLSLACAVLRCHTARVPGSRPCEGLSATDLIAPCVELCAPGFQRARGLLCFSPADERSPLSCSFSVAYQRAPFISASSVLPPLFVCNILPSRLLNTPLLPNVCLAFPLARPLFCSARARWSPLALPLRDVAPSFIHPLSVDAPFLCLSRHPSHGFDHCQP